MKRLWYVIILVAIALSICFTELCLVKSSYTTFMETIDNGRTAMLKGDYNGANRLSKELENQWYNREKKLNYLMEHTVLDDISMNISEMSDYTNEESKDDYFSANDRIKKQLTILYTNELPYGDNIF